MVKLEAIFYQILKDYLIKDGNLEISIKIISRENVGSSPRLYTVNLYDNNTKRNIIRSEYIVYINIKKGKSKGNNTKTLQLINKVFIYRYRGI